MKIAVSYINDKGITETSTKIIKFKTRQPPQMASILSSKNQTFKIVHMAVPQPTIVPSLDQIGLASLSIPFSVIEADHENKTFTAFAIQKFGEVGVPLKRINLYAFTGKVEDDYFVMDCRNCEFEITSFAIPLDLFRISGFLRTDGTVAKGGSLLIEKNWGNNMFTLLRDLAKNSPISVKMLMNHLRAGGLVQFFKAAKDFFPALFRQLFRGTWQSWGLLNHNNKLTGVGTFRLEPIPNEKESMKKSILVDRFEFDISKNQIMADIKVSERDDKWETVISILLINKIKKMALPINYNSAIKYKDLGGGMKRVMLSIPKSMKLHLKKITAYLMADIYPVKKLEL